MESNQRRVISLLVDNQSGVLARVSNLFCRRGFNIDSLTVSATNDPTVSRITVSVSGTEKELQQLILQTERLEVTRQVFVLNESTALERELLLLKVMANVTNRAELREIAGIYTEIPFKTYPNGFPKEFMEAFEKEIGVGCLGNYPASGTEIIEELGPEHEATGKPIVYTSADSVFQIAANTAVIPLERLYEICETARKLLVGDWACGRVIARPYIINEEGKRERTSDRRDYSVTPPADTILDAIKNAGKMVYGVGKIGDIFNMKGLMESVHTTDNMDGVDKTIEAINMGFEGFVFTNLVDFDSKYGHRRDPIGYGKAIEEFDARLPEIMDVMGPEDVLMICADHGNDPTAPGTDHTREYIPLIVYGKECREGVNLGTRSSFADIGATVCDLLEVGHSSVGTGFKNLIIK